MAAVKKKREAEAIAREAAAAAAAAAEDARSEAAAHEEPAVKQQTPPPMTAEEIATALEAEGLMLLPSRREGAKTGYKGVYPTGDPKSPYVAQLRRDGRNIVLGKFMTAAEAALAYARAIGPAEVRDSAAALHTRPLSVREVAAAARAEGLCLRRSEKVASGYEGVSIGTGERKRPYNVVLRGNFLGCFESAEEAALVYARATRPVRLTSMAGSSMALAGLTGAARALEGVAD